MADFSPELFFDLAQYADNNDKYFKGLSPKLPGGFDESDLPKIDAFKDAIFMVIMLRAARYMELTRQKNIDDQTLKHAYGHFGVLLFSGDVHEEDVNDQKKILESDCAKNEILNVVGPIPRKTIRSILDNDISSKILDDFDASVLALACKLP